MRYAILKGCDLMDIHKIVEKLCRKYGTRNPFELARCRGIAVIYEDLGSVNGYYTCVLRMKQIHINSSLDSPERIYTASHELGHAVLHPNAHTPFLRKNTFFSIDKLERQADTFAAELLIPDELLFEAIDREYTIRQLARMAGCYEGLAKLRLEHTNLNGQ